MPANPPFDKLLNKILQLHNEVQESVINYFNQYEPQVKKLHLVKDRLASFKKQIEQIQAHQREHGELPTVKGQDSTSDYLDHLFETKKAYAKECKELTELLLKVNKKNWQELEDLCKIILKVFKDELTASRFIAHFVLTLPQGSDGKRQTKNQRLRPLFHAALAICFLKKLVATNKIDSPLLAEFSSDIFETELEELNEEQLANYRNFELQFIKPIIKAALLQHIGIFSKEVEQLVGENPFRELSAIERKKYLALTFKKSNEYIEHGIGTPAFDDEDEEQQEQQSIEFINQILVEKNSSKSQFGDILRIPMVYASYILSTKGNFDAYAVFKVYNMMDQAISKKLVDQSYTKAFLDMMGKYPVGSGIYFVAQGSNEIENAIVMYINPASIDEPICKQVTKAKVSKIDHRELIISYANNLDNEEARSKLPYDADYYQKQYPQGFFWNAAEKWETQIPPNEFWSGKTTREQH